MSGRPMAMIASFNSTMVRLKALRLLGRGQLPAFQFHYGTIKRRNANWDYVLKTSFQFHYGTIKRRFVELSLLEADVSIPLWYD